jgi:hypothetical protein
VSATADRLSSPASGPPAPILSSYEAYGCTVNAIGVDELFRRYEQAGFLYPSKMARIAPFMPLVKDNWRRGMRGGELILHTILSEHDEGTEWAAITSWRSTHTGWNGQHLAAVGGPNSSRAVMLSACAIFIEDQLDTSQQNWFQRTNRFANKVFGSITDTLGASMGWVKDYSYFAIDLARCAAINGNARVKPVGPSDAKSMREMADRSRSPVFSVGEGLDNQDLELEAVDELYRKVGLRRYRRVLMATVPGHEGIAGFALVYRGPLGFNFSFLENRCDLVLDPNLSRAGRDSVVASLLGEAAKHYVDFVPGMVPVIVDQRDSSCVKTLGGVHIRDYAQSVWLRPGFEPWYRHVEQIYDRAIRAGRRHGLARKNAADGGMP